MHWQLLHLCCKCSWATITDSIQVSRLLDSRLEQFMELLFENDSSLGFMGTFSGIHSVTVMLVEQVFT